MSEIFPKVDPDEWLPTTQRALHDYLKRNFNLDIHDIVVSFAEADDKARNVPLEKRIIHMEIDVIDNRPLGFGDGVVNRVYDDPNFEVVEEEAQWHEINFDVGVWASDETGGVTAQLRAYQQLADLLDGPSAQDRVLEETGVEILSFRGGNFLVEKIGDVRMYRVVDVALIVRVAGRKTGQPMTYIDEINQIPELEIGGEVIVDVGP